jgi:hypothetical protein
MKVKIKNNTHTIDQFLTRLFFLCYKACHGACGMGALQEARLCGRLATEEQVYHNVKTAGDYAMNFRAPDEIYADYVFGRMIKFGCRIDGDTMEFSDTPFRRDYQGFAGTYPNVTNLLHATQKSLDCELEIS